MNRKSSKAISISIIFLVRVFILGHSVLFVLDFGRSERVWLWHLRIFLGIFLNIGRLSRVVTCVALLEAEAYVHRGALARLRNRDGAGPPE